MSPSEPGSLSPQEDARAAIGRLLRRGAEQRRRADRAEAIADDYEERLAAGPAHLRPLYARLAALHRQMEARHHASAALHELHASRMAAWLDGEPGVIARPVFVSAVAAAIGAASVTAMVRGRRPAAVVSASSDATAQAAHDLEVALGEGPATAAGAGLIRVGGPSLLERWPLYGPAVAEVGVRAVIAVPLRLPGSCLGALCVYDAVPDIRDEMVAAASRIADALTYTVLLTPQEPGAGEQHQGDGGGLASPLLFEVPDYQAVVHQAAGMVAVHCDCAIDDAEVLLQARAFAEGLPVEQVAQSVLHGETRLC